MEIIYVTNSKHTNNSLKFKKKNSGALTKTENLYQSQSIDNLYRTENLYLVEFLGYKTAVGLPSQYQCNPHIQCAQRRLL